MTNDTNPVRRVTLTPALAREWLAYNTRNRRPSEVTIRLYRRDMMEGRWMFAGDPIRFSVTGALLDGQHRLMALAGCPDGTEVDFLVISKLPAEAQVVMDQGKKRSPGDQLALVGAKDVNVVAAAIRQYLTHEMGLAFRDAKLQSFSIPTTEVQAWFLENRELVERAQAAATSTRSSDAPPSTALCAAMMFICEYGDETTAEFFRLLAAGAGEGHPINALDKRLQRIRRNKIKSSHREYLALFIQAMNAWLDGRTLTKFQMPRGAKWTAENFPRLRSIA